MKSLLLFLVPVFMILTLNAQEKKSFYDFNVTDIDGQPFNLSTLKGKKVLVVNVASKCGFTPQYKQLEEVYKKYGGEKFTIIAFPANNFFHQEPGTNKEIKQFCSENYGVTFPVMSKISVKGDDIDPLYKWLTTKSENGVMDSKVKWNFQKYMIDENGTLIDSVSPNKKPDCDKIINWIEGGNPSSIN